MTDIGSPDWWSRNARMITAAIMVWGGLFLVWVAVGVVGSLRGERFSGWYFAIGAGPLVPFVVAATFDWAMKQSFAAQSWGNRLAEVPRVVVADPYRRWLPWLFSIFVGVPYGIYGLVVGEPEASRVASAALVPVSAAVAWVGIKIIDARIARRLHQEAVETGHRVE